MVEGSPSNSELDQETLMLISGSGLRSGTTKRRRRRACDHTGNRSDHTGNRCDHTGNRWACETVSKSDQRQNNEIQWLWHFLNKLEWHFTRYKLPRQSIVQYLSRSVRGGGRIWHWNAHILFGVRFIYTTPHISHDQTKHRYTGHNRNAAYLTHVVKRFNRFKTM